jgi:hypothetical protein
VVLSTRDRAAEQGEEAWQRARRSLVIKPLKPVGAEVTGLDLNQPLSRKRGAGCAGGTPTLLLFRDQTLTQPDLKRIATIFGGISDQGQAPGGMNLVSNVNPPGLNEKGEQHAARRRWRAAHALRPLLPGESAGHPAVQRRGAAHRRRRAVFGH